MRFSITQNSDLGTTSGDVFSVLIDVGGQLVQVVVLRSMTVRELQRHILAILAGKSQLQGVAELERVWWFSAECGRVLSDREATLEEAGVKGWSSLQLRGGVCGGGSDEVDEVLIADMAKMRRLLQSIDPNIEGVLDDLGQAARDAKKEMESELASPTFDIDKFGFATVKALKAWAELEAHMTLTEPIDLRLASKVGKMRNLLERMAPPDSEGNVSPYATLVTALREGSTKAQKNAEEKLNILKQKHAHEIAKLHKAGEETEEMMEVHAKAIEILQSIFADAKKAIVDKDAEVGKVVENLFQDVKNARMEAAAMKKAKEDKEAALIEAETVMEGLCSEVNDAKMEAAAMKKSKDDKEAALIEAETVMEGLCSEVNDAKMEAAALKKAKDDKEAALIEVEMVMEGLCREVNNAQIEAETMRELESNASNEEEMALIRMKAMAAELKLELKITRRESRNLQEKLTRAQNELTEKEGVIEHLSLPEWERTLKLQPKASSINITSRDLQCYEAVTKLTELLQHSSESLTELNLRYVPWYIGMQGSL
jgi:hypothetical protein